MPAIIPLSSHNGMYGLKDVQIDPNSLGESSASRLLRRFQYCLKTIEWGDRFGDDKNKNSQNPTLGLFSDAVFCVSNINHSFFLRAIRG